MGPRIDRRGNLLRYSRWPRFHDERPERPARHRTRRDVAPGELCSQPWSKHIEMNLSHTIHPARVPNAPRMVLIHSLALDKSIWDGVVAAVAGRAEILTYDCRGHGRSIREG